MSQPTLSVNFGSKEVPTLNAIATRFWRAGLATAKHYKDAPVKERYGFDLETYQNYYKPLLIKRYTLDIWNKVTDEIEQAILSGETHFLNRPLISDAIFSTSDGAWERHAVSYLESRYSTEELCQKLQENTPLQPPIFNATYICSETTLIHMAQLAFFSEKMNTPLDTLPRVVEFGAGYGSMVRLLRRYNPKGTYVIIDLPIMLILQQYYLANIFGAEATHLLRSNGEEIIEGKINFVPITFEHTLMQLKTFSPDVFIACFSLNEANSACQKLIWDCRYFGAQKTLISYYFQNTSTLPTSTNIKLTVDFEVVYQGPTVFSPGGEQRHMFARKTA